MNLLIAALLACCLVIPPYAHAQEHYGDPHVPVAGKALGTVIHTQDAEELRYVILKRLTDRYANEKGITVTQAEKAAYVKRVQEVVQNDRERQLARRNELSRKLAAGGLPEAERKALESELDTTNNTLAALGERGSGAPAPEEVKAREEIAAAFIRQWKINRALYQQYGGRIIFQQGGPEPLDAYRRFLEEARSHGDFEIADKDLEAGFWRYYLNDAIHSFYVVDSKEEAQALGTPPWLMAPAN